MNDLASAKKQLLLLCVVSMLVHVATTSVSASAQEVDGKELVENRLGINGLGEAKQAAENAEAVGPGPKPVLDPANGKNLLGQKIADAKKGLPDEKRSSRVKIIEAAIKESIGVNQSLASLNQSFVEKNSLLMEKRHEQKGLENKFFTARGNWAEATERMNRLAPALNFPPSNPQHQEYFVLKIKAQGFAAAMNMAQKRKQQLPLEIRNLENEQRLRRAGINKVFRKAAEMNAGWIRLLSPLEHFSQSEAEQIAEVCELQLVSYPNVLPPRAMLGLAKLHLEQPKAAVEHFDRSLATPLAQSDITDPIRQCCLIGKTWALLNLSEEEAAGSLIFTLRKQLKRNYEVTLCEARLWELRDRPKEALTTYQRATRIKVNRPDAYRMAAKLVLKSNVREPSVAVSLAEKAVRVDERNDFRNHVAAALAYEAVKESDKQKTATDQARQYAGAENQDLVDELLASSLVGATKTASIDGTASNE